MFKAAIYDTQFLSSEGIKTVLKSKPETNTVRVFESHLKLSAQIEQYTPDLLILEYLGDNPLSADAIKEIKRQFGFLKILIISEDDDTIEIKKRIAIGVEGFLTKKCSGSEIQLAIDTVKNGGRFYCQRILDIMTNQEEALAVELTERESQIIRMISKGASSTEMAKKLNLSIHTINSHRKNILKKLGFRSPAELIAYAVKKMG